MRRAVAVLGLVVALAGYLAFRPQNRVTIGASLSGGTHAATLRLDEPFRALLALARPLEAAGRAHVEIRRVDGAGERVEREYTARASTGNDELFLAFPRTGSVVDGPGTFRVVFVLEGKELASGSMEVTR
jgi:hypothetical protein